MSCNFRSIIFMSCIFNFHASLLGPLFSRPAFSVPPPPCAHILIPHERSFIHPSFLIRMVGGVSPCTWNFGQNSLLERKCRFSRVHINQAISRYRSRNWQICDYSDAQRSYDIIHVFTARQAQTKFTATFTQSYIIGQHTVRQTMQNGNNYLKDWKVPNRRPVGVQYGDQ